MQRRRMCAVTSYDRLGMGWSPAVIAGAPSKLGSFEGPLQIENEAPQPQEEVAWGFLIWNEAPISSST